MLAFIFALLSFAAFQGSASEQLVPRQSTVCHRTPRSNFLSDEQWADDFIDFEGKLLPLMKSLMCKEKCALMKTQSCALNVVVIDNIRVSFTITRNDALGNLWSCEDDIWDGLIDCLRGNSPLSGGQINSNGDIFDISLEKYELPEFIEQTPSTGDLPLPDPGNGDQFPPDINQDPTFYISVTNLVDGASGITGEVAVYGRNAQYDIMAPKRQDYTTHLEFYVGPDMFPNPNFWYDSYAAFDQFTLRGNPSGRICGLQEDFMFVKTRPGRFAFTDQGEEGEFIGYCDLLPKPKSPQEPLEPGEQPPATGTVGYTDDGLNNRIYVVYYPMFACFANGIPNYCTDYGSS